MQDYIRYLLLEKYLSINMFANGIFSNLSDPKKIWLSVHKCCLSRGIWYLCSVTKVTLSIAKENPPGLNFINVKCTIFCMNVVLAAFLQLHVRRKTMLYEKFECKMLMKLTADIYGTHLFLYFTFKLSILFKKANYFNSTVLF